MKWLSLSLTILFKDVLVATFEQFNEEQLFFNFIGTSFDNFGSINFACNTDGIFVACAVEFLIDQVTEDEFRSHNNSCYHRKLLCDPDLCDCNDECLSFQWNHTMKISMVTTEFSCSGIIAKFGHMYRAKSSLIFNKNDNSITFSGKTITILRNANSTKDYRTATQSPSNNSKLNTVAILCITIGATTLGAFLLALFIYFYKRKYIKHKETTTCQSFEMENNLWKRKIFEDEDRSIMKKVVESKTYERNSNESSTTYRHMPKKSNKLGRQRTSTSSEEDSNINKCRNIEIYRNEMAMNPAMGWHRTPEKLDKRRWKMKEDDIKSKHQKFIHQESNTSGSQRTSISSVMLDSSAPNSLENICAEISRFSHPADSVSLEATNRP